MAGCTGYADYIGVDKHQPGNNEWVTDVDMPVPVVIDAALSSKGALESLDDMAEKLFAFFAYDKNVTDSLDGGGMGMYNCATKYKRYNDGGGGFRFVEPVFCYPVDSDAAFTFYAYHALGLGNDNNDNVRISSNASETAVFATVPVATGEDVLWGFASVEDENGFNAQYLRSHPDKLPEMTFSHVTALVTFTASLNDDDRTEDIRIKGLKLYDIPIGADLCIVHKAKVIGVEPLEGKLISYQYGDKEERWTAIRFADFYHELFVAPQAGEFFECSLILEVASASGEINEEETEKVEVNPTDFLPVSLKKNGFCAGYGYNFNLAVVSADGKYQLELQKRIADE